MLELELKPNSISQYRFVMWDLHPTCILWDCFISNWCETSNGTIKCSVYFKL